MPTTAPAKLTLPIYSYSEADRLARVSRGTSKRWLEGYKYADQLGQTVSRPPVSPSENERGVGFVDLVEVTAIGALRGAGFDLKKIRQIVADCEDLFGTRYPIASHEFETNGREIFVRIGDKLVGLLSRKWETAWREVLHPFLNQLDYEQGFASRWYPLGREGLVVLDPDYGFGLPVIEGTGFRTEIIAERFEYELPGEIANDLGISESQVERALQFEWTRARQAA